MIGFEYPLERYREIFKYPLERYNTNSDEEEEIIRKRNLDKEKDVESFEEDESSLCGEDEPWEDDEDEP